MTKKKVFCTKCGTKNNIKDKTCIKCHKSLTRKFNPLLEYMKSKVKDDLKDNVTDKFFSIITNYIKSNLYGAILSVSILVSATCVVVNEVVDSNEIQKVTKMPTIVNEFNYGGEGLSALEVVRKYVNAIDANDFNTVKSLQLENFHKDVYSYIKEYSDKNAKYPYEIAVDIHELADNPKIYFSYNQGDIDIEFSSEDEYPNHISSNYTTENLYVDLHYCSYNSCDRYGHSTARIRMQLVNIDGNYYVLGEVAGQLLNGMGEIAIQALYRANGDTTKISFYDVMNEYWSCEDIDDLIKHGYKDPKEIWGW